ncbi:MAG: hypothetical protein C5B60_09800 [Chloroflexi bacterium]|nr:MAG: hypothetical protein C5B60_09800 [Chloroflexota bacterium]
MPSPEQTTNVWQAFPDPSQFADLLMDMEGGRTNPTIVRNNNPGNLKDPTTGQFRRFSTWEEGRTALIRQLQAWRVRNPNWSIADFNANYAPDQSRGGDNPNGTEHGRNLRMLGVSSRTGSSEAVQSSGQMSISDFASQIREGFPQINQMIDSQTGQPVTDEAIVRGVLKRRPDLLNRIQTQESRAGHPATVGRTAGEYAGDIASSAGGFLADLFRGAEKRSAREYLTMGPPASPGTVPGIFGSRPAEPVQLPPQEEAAFQQFQTRHPTLANLGGSLFPKTQQKIAQGVQQAITPTNTAQQYGQYIPDVFAAGQTLRDLPGLVRGAYRVASGVPNPFMWPNTAIRNIAETVWPSRFSDLFRGIGGPGTETIFPRNFRQLGEAIRGSLPARPAEFSSGFRDVMQKVAGAGREPIVQDIRAAQNANLEALGKHEEAVANAERKYNTAKQEYLDKKARGEQADAEKLRQAAKEWRDRQYEHSLAKSKAESITRQQEVLQRGVDAYADRARENLTRTHNIAESRLNSRYYHLQQSIENALPGEKGYANSEHIKEVIDYARDKFLLGSPDDVKTFNNLVRWMTESTEPGAEAGLRNLPWGDVRVHHSAMGDQIRPGNNLPGNVVQAIRYVREKGTGAELMRIAKEAGMGEVYAKLTKDYRQFKIDWSDRGEVSQGASPLRPGLARQDNAPLVRDVTGDAGDRFLSILAKYKKDGANIRLFEGIRDLTTKAENLGKVAIPREHLVRVTMPRDIEPFQAPKTTEPPTPPEFRPPARPKLRIPRPEQVRQELLERRAGRPFNTRELQLLRGHGQRVLRHWLSDPAFRARVARQIPKGGELEP